MIPSTSNICVPNELIDQIKITIKYWKKNEHIKKQISEALDCDNKMNQVLNDLYMKPMMWTRAKAYKHFCPHWLNLIGPHKAPYDNFYDDLRRPVLMKGSLEYLYRRYSKSYYASSCGNGWAEKVLERYIRRSRFTSLDWSECLKFISIAKSKLREKHYTTYHFESRIVYKDQRIIGGRIVYLENNQITYLQRLDNIRKKTIKLENRCGRTLW